MRLAAVLNVWRKKSNGCARLYQIWYLSVTIISTVT